MSEVPMEYKVMKKKFTMSLTKNLGNEIKSILVFGGAAANKVYSGVSDMDFMIIIDSMENLTSITDTYNKIGNEILAIIDNPLFASILDYEIYSLDQLPNNKNLNGFSPMKILSLKNAEVLFGENYFKDININEDDLKAGSMLMINDYFSKLLNYKFTPGFDPLYEEDTIGEDFMQDMSEGTFIAVDAILLSFQAYLMYKKQGYIAMPDVVYEAEKNPIEGLDNELIKDAGYLKQGVEHEVENLLDRALEFCGKIINMIVT